MRQRQPTYQALIYAQSLALFVIICENPFFMNFFICANHSEFLHIVQIFLFLSLRISFYLCLFVKIFFIYAHL